MRIYAIYSIQYLCGPSPLALMKTHWQALVYMSCKCALTVTAEAELFVKINRKYDY